MASHNSPTILLLLLTFTFLSTTTITTTTTTTTTTSPYLSPTTLPQNYQNMLSSFKIYMYTPSTPSPFQTPPSSLFYTSLLNSPFITQDPKKAHLFLLPFSPTTSTRALTRLVRDIRTEHPYWNRTLGADHFFLSPNGIDHSSDRNLVELKKNAVQVSTFPTTSGNFIPHKDISLPTIKPNPLTRRHTLSRAGNASRSLLGFLKWDGQTENDIVNELKMDVDFLVDSEPLDYVRSKFCLFFYSGDVAWMVEAMGLGCVPVLIVDRPIQDLPLMDVLRWSEMGILIGTRGGVRGLKEVLVGVGEERYEKMRGLCVEASRHLVWNAEPQPLDAFHMVVYQLWLRRHTIRYARRDWA